MDIKINEFKKIINSPVIIGLLILFIIFNSITIFQNSYIKNDLKVVNNIIYKFGYEIDDEMESKFKDYYNSKLKKLNEITEKKESKTYTSIEEFYNEHRYDVNEIYNEEEMNFIKELEIIEVYYYKIKEIDSSYSRISIMESAESEINKYKLSGKAADTVRYQYMKFNERFNKLVNNREHKNLFFLGQVYRLHSLLFKTLFRIILFEIIILGLLITSYLTNYEFENNTEAITYSSKRGRKFILDKLYVAIISNILMTTTILITSLGLYFIVFNYSGLWNIPISSYFNAEYMMPYMSWWNMSFIQYLFSSIGLIYTIVLLFTGITFIIARFIKNNYIVFFSFAIIFGLFLILPMILPLHSNIVFLGGFTPFFLVMNPYLWFMESDAFTTFKYYELITVFAWGVLIVVLGILSIKRFKKQNI